MGGLTLFGFVAVTLVLVFYALEDRHASLMLNFAAVSQWDLFMASGKVHGLFGLVEAVWTLIALRRYM